MSALRESCGQAVARVCDDVRAFIHARYQGEIRARGYQFMATVFTELLAMCVAIELANSQDPETVEVRLERLAIEMEPRLLHYLAVVEQHQPPTTEDEPGTSTPPNPARLM